MCVSCPGKNYNSNGSDNVSSPGENVKNSIGGKANVSCLGKNHNLNGCNNVSSLGENVESSSECKHHTSDPGEKVKNFCERGTSFTKENAKNSTQCQGYASDRGNVKDFKGCNKRPFADPATSIPNKKNNSSSDYSKADTTSGIDAASGSCRTRAPDGEEPYSVACCLKILHSMKEVDLHLLVAAVELFEGPVHRKYFVRSKNENRLGWLPTLCNIHH